jgi:phenol hydroxylase P4 protein
MSVVAIQPDYASHTEVRDARANFHGNIVVYVHWEKHLSFCAALAFPLPPAMPFGALVEQVIKPHYAAHPDAAKIDWGGVTWQIDGAPATPDLAASLEANGIGHKSLVRFWTPGLDGYQGVAG